MAERTTDEIQRNIGKMFDQIISNLNMIEDAVKDISEQAKPKRKVYSADEKAIDDYYAYESYMHNTE